MEWAWLSCKAFRSLSDAGGQSCPASLDQRPTTESLHPWSQVVGKGPADDDALAQPLRTMAYQVLQQVMATMAWQSPWLVSMGTKILARSRSGVTHPWRIAGRGDIEIVDAPSDLFTFTRLRTYL